MPASATTADRNLLFGILAVQMNFISKDALINAMHAWVLDKQKSLGQILLDQKALPADTHLLLDALVQKHLEAHGGDAEKSLAGVSSVGSIRNQLRQIADSDVQASLACVSSNHSADGDPFATHGGHLPAAAGSAMRYRVLRPHARGGLGEVFVAKDEELNREVALKEIQNRHADNPASRARFVLEAEITGGLEHPGIVPVYGLGTYADGRPFYAMRFIRGDSLKDAIDRYYKEDGQKRDPGERAVEFRKLLGRFVDVCNAIAYAHSRGVLHRDLKPGNIMLGKYGETLVVDWGLAKSIGVKDVKSTEETPLQPSAQSGTAETVAGSAIGTPQFMSPEQAAGRLDQLGPASDVYSLGATLYVLLTGNPPFRDTDVGQMLNKVQRGDFPRPSQMRRDVPRPLDAICLKAMSLRPEDRYTSPRALADDVEHWRADEPVTAYREPLGTYLRRWVRRHRTMGVTGGILLLLIIMFMFAGRVIAAAVSDTRREIIHDVQGSTRLTADLAAQAVGDRVRQRRNVLEREASIPTLAKLLKNAQDQGPDSPEVKDLQTYLDEREGFYEYLNISDNWWIMDAKGKLLDVSGPGDARRRAQRVVGQYMWDRDFFHGRGTNLTPHRDQSKPENVRPLDGFHQSIVFQSSTKGSPFIVSFSVPVKDKSGQVLGILAMAARLAGFSELSSANERSAAGGVPNQWITLVQTRELTPDPNQWNENVPNRGLIIEHPELRRFYAMDRKQDVPLVHIDGSVLERLQADKQALDYRDPFGNLQPDYQGRYVAAVEPVIYRHRVEHGNQTEAVNTGWIVLVQEDYAKAIAPVEALRNQLIVQGMIGLATIISLIVASWLVVNIRRPSRPLESLCIGGLIVVLGLIVAAILGAHLGRFVLFVVLPLATVLCSVGWVFARVQRRWRS